MRRYFDILVSGFMLAACASLNPPAPDVSPDPRPEVPASTVNIPVTASLGALQALADASVPASAGAAPFNESFGTGGPDYPSCGFNAGYNVSRSPISLTGADASITTSFTVSYGAKIRHRVPCPGPLLSVGCGVDGDPPRSASASLTTAIAVDSKWNFSSQTRNNGVSAGNRCKVSILNIDVTDRITNKLGDRLTAMAGQLDQQIVTLVKLKARASEAWARLQEPVTMGDGMYLMLNPESASLVSPTVNGNVIQTNVGLRARPQIILGKQPAPGTAPLPDAGAPDGGNAFNVSLPVKATYAFVDAQIRKALDLEHGGFRYPPVGKKHVVIQDVQTFGYGKKAVVRVQFKGSAKGIMYLTGTPQYDVINDVLSFPDLDYTIETKNLILKAMNWFNHDQFRDALRERLALKLSDKMTTARDGLRSALNSKVGSVQLSGTLTQLSLLGVYASPKTGTFDAYVLATGTLSSSVP